MRELLPYFALAVSVIACALSAWTAVRAGRWRESDSAKELMRRVGESERLIGLHAQRLLQIEEDIQALPTKADFARLEGEIHLTCKIADRTERAVARLEGFLMERKP
ncbi:hypothetical protein [Brevundimonas sp.]|uniref:hypothetical protein n=1 Tax=Brevundimonas sp. TaxID=1871086 RepID=UPI003513F9D5